MSQLKTIVSKYRKNINPPYSRNDFPAIGGTFLLLFVALLAVIYLPNRLKTERDRQSQADTLPTISCTGSSTGGTVSARKIQLNIDCPNASFFKLSDSPDFNESSSSG